MNVESSIVASYLKLGEYVAHDAAPAGESPGAQFTPNLHGIATARGDPFPQVLPVSILPVSIKQADARITLCPLQEGARVQEAAYCSTIDVQDSANGRDGLAVDMAAHDLLVSLQPVLTPCFAVTLGSREHRLDPPEGAHP